MLLIVQDPLALRQHHLRANTHRDVEVTTAKPSQAKSGHQGDIITAIEDTEKQMLTSTFATDLVTSEP